MLFLISVLLALWGDSSLYGQQATRDNNLNMAKLQEPVDRLETTEVPHTFMPNTRKASCEPRTTHLAVPNGRVAPYRCRHPVRFFGKSTHDTDPLFRTSNINQYVKSLAEKVRQRPGIEESRLINASQHDIHHYLIDSRQTTGIPDITN